MRDGRIIVSGLLCAAVTLGIHVPEFQSRAGIWHGEARVMSGTQTGAAHAAGTHVVPISTEGLHNDFQNIGYRLDAVREGRVSVPRVYVKAIPPDIREINSVTTRKAVFIKTMLPLILRVNEELRSTRARIQALSVQPAGALAPGDRTWLDTQYRRNGVEPGDLATLLRRVDVIPPSLALAQAAEESGWGTSRFALEGRALFGQRTYQTNLGLMPEGVDKSAKFRVRAFGHLLEAVRSYARNLNTHNAYAPFRELRERLRMVSHGAAVPDSMRLAEMLHAYSERGPAYIETIKTIIRANSLRELDGARLSENTVALPKRSKDA